MSPSDPFPMPTDNSVVIKTGKPCAGSPAVAHLHFSLKLPSFLRRRMGSRGAVFTSTNNFSYLPAAAYYLIPESSTTDANHQYMHDVRVGLDCHTRSLRKPKVLSQVQRRVSATSSSHPMDGKNFSGRMVSLLNNHHQSKLPPLRLSESSRASSYSTRISRGNSYSSQTSLRNSPIHSPTTPQLVTIDSGTSQCTMETPSPITPTYPFEPLEQPRSFDPYGRCYPTSTYPVPHPGEHAERPYYQLSTRDDSVLDDGYDCARPGSRNGDLRSPSEVTSPLDQQAALKPAPKRNKYPCPHAQRFNCIDTFTTSGHAARHGKKHTGEKNILCPDCSKAFTRKDNMKQHQRTHQSRRESAKTSKEREEQRRSKAKAEQLARVERKSSRSVRMGEPAAKDTVVIDGIDMAASAGSLPYAHVGSGLRINTGPSSDRMLASLGSPSDRLDALATAAIGMPFSPGGTSRYEGDDCMVH